MTLFHDRATISGAARITPEGYFVADALVARGNNVQIYHARELELTDREPDAPVRVFRPESEVFAADSIATAARLPIVLDHPVQDGKPVMVDAKNWVEFARGETDNQVLRDGEFMRVPLRITDADAVRSVQTDRQEFSLGYTAEIRMQDGSFVDANGETIVYDAVATNFQYNHLAACRSARGGSELRITDERTNGVQKMPEIKVIDGLPVDISDAGAVKVLVDKLIADRDSAVIDMKAAQAAVTERDVTIAARDAEIVTLKDAVTKATPNAKALQDAAASYARTVAAAKAMGVTVTDAMDEPAIMAAVTVHKMGDKAANYTPEQHTAAFTALVDALPAGSVVPPAGGDALRSMFVDAGGPVNLGDAVAQAQAAKVKRYDRYANAHAAAPTVQ